MKKCKKRDNKDWETLPVLEVYNNVLNGNFKKFPYHYLSKERARTILRYVALTKHNMTREQICKDININFLRNNLLGNFNKLFDSDWYHMISYCFNEMDIKPWELIRVKEGFWKDINNRVSFITWAAKKENIDITKAEDLRKLSSELLHKLGGKTAITTEGSVFELLSYINPMNYKEWEICNLTFWNDKKRKEAIKWLIEEKLRWDTETVENCLTAEHFYQNNLASVFDYFHHNRNKVLEFAYPGKYSRLKRSPINERYAQNETI